MALIALAADKGAPGVTTAAVALGAVWPRPVLVAECDQAGGDLVYRLPAAADDTAGRGAARDGGMLNPSRGLLSLAATARRGLRPEQIAEHCQRLVGGLDVLVGITSAEQAQGMTWLWGPLGRAFAGLAPVDVLADCGRLGAGTPLNDLMREADMVVLFTRATLEQVAHLRERVSALTAELRGGPPIGVIVLADPRDFRASIAEVDRIISSAQHRLNGPDGPVSEPGPVPPPVTVLGGLALDPKGAELLSGRWGGRLDRSLLIRSAREVAGTLAGRLATAPGPAGAVPDGSPAGPGGPGAGALGQSPPYTSPPPASHPSREGAGPPASAPQYQEGRR
ncbi:hypothetical protein GCM10023085_75050 [Actinomadura viridis]|uniref:MinD-like ATPase involved in chromosome partitioning or flagellar assembly n=1 Tax=Actinomadura viridis TaxID=58110 RepID=A0A931DGS7_9ACTN|nr:hypothetical protein [Actinomadura viridis]MBG6086610.1 hypothetical protein [Actinomadura viridis]